MCWLYREAKPPRDPVRLSVPSESCMYLRIINFIALKLMEFYLVINIDVTCTYGSPKCKGRGKTKLLDVVRKVGTEGKLNIEFDHIYRSDVEGY